MPMTLDQKVDALDSAKVIKKAFLNETYRNRIENLSDEDVSRLIEIADKLDPNRTSPFEIALLF